MEGLDQVSEDRRELYICSTPAGLWIPILVQPSAVNDDIPQEADIDIEVLGLKGVRAGGLSGMRVKDLKERQQDTKCEKDPEGRKWDPVVRLVQVMFRNGNVLGKIAWEMMVLLQKDKGGYRGIGIVEVLWKV